MFKFKIISILIVFITTLSLHVYANEPNIRCSTISEYNADYAINNSDELLLWEENRHNKVWDGDYDYSAEPIKLLEDVASVKGEMAITKDGSLWVWNHNNFIEDSLCSLVPAKVMENVIDVEYGQSNTLVLKNDYTLWSVGFDYSINKFTNTPQKIMNNVIDMDTGAYHSVILKTDGSVWTFGLNGFGALGIDKDIEQAIVPVKIMDNVKKVYAGISSGFAIDEDNNLWRWGCNYGGMIGGKPVCLYSPVKYISDVKQVSSQWGFNLVLKNDNTLWIYGENEQEERVYVEGGLFLDTPVQIAQDVNSISGWGFSCALVLKNNGELSLFTVSKINKPYEFKKLCDDIKLNNDEFSFKNIKFNDIQQQPEDVQHSINRLGKAGIVTGISDTEYAPEKEVTRAEATALLLRLIGKTTAKETTSFVDVTSDKWYCDIASAGVESGIINGFEDNTFRGEEKVTAMQFVTMASRVLKAESFAELDESISNGNLELPEWAKQSVQLAINEGLILENEVSFIEQTSIDRGTAALILYRLYNKI